MGTDTIRTELLELVKSISISVERNGSAKISTCDAPNWDMNTWNYREEIKEALRNKGYRISETVNHGVTDIVITKTLTI
jgi:hypothetical protein